MNTNTSNSEFLSAVEKFISSIPCNMDTETLAEEVIDSSDFRYALEDQVSSAIDDHFNYHFNLSDYLSSSDIEDLVCGVDMKSIVIDQMSEDNGFVESELMNLFEKHPQILSDFFRTSEGQNCIVNAIVSALKDKINANPI